MEYFIVASFIGILLLLVAHMVDYAVDALRRFTAGASMPDEYEPIGKRGPPVQEVHEYDQAA